MKHKKLLTILTLALFVAFLALNVRVGYAAPRSGYEISWYTIDGGGAQDLSGGTYTLSGTVGQFDAGSQSGGSYALAGGYWVELFGYRLSLPLILR
jgi:hypothetical protein